MPTSKAAAEISSPSEQRKRASWSTPRVIVAQVEDFTESGSLNVPEATNGFLS
jgi:hypothetical protein